MSLKILGGKLRGLEMKAPPEETTRPTLTLLRRRIFDARQDLSEYSFVDLCAGSGSMGFEAISRGASEVHFVEKNHKAYSFIQENILRAKKFYSEANYYSHKQDALIWLKDFFEKVKESEKIILYFDPPYEDKELYLKVINLVNDSDFKGEFWIESCRQKGLKVGEIEVMAKRNFKKVYEQGTSFLGILSYL